MIRMVLLIRKRAALTACSVLLLLTVGCGGGSRVRDNFVEFVSPTDISIIRHHMRQHRQSLLDFTTRLYAKNPRYEKDLALRQRKINAIFHKGLAAEYLYAHRPSHEILSAAFQEETAEEPDRVYLLGLGLWKSVREAYTVRDDEEVLLSALQIPLERLQRLHHNISQVNWRLKTYRDRKGELLFRTNEVGADGTFNMAYEVIMTRVLTRIEDDIVMRGGLPEKYVFRMSTLFVGIAL